jgi:hypothetical protein
MQQGSPENKSVEKKYSFLWIVGIIILTVCLSVAATFWVFNHYFFPKKYDPIVLSQEEDENLSIKLEQFSWFGDNHSAQSDQGSEGLAPEKYSEQGAVRGVSFTERELNALLAKNTDLADKFVVDLSDNLASGKLLVPMDEDFPIVGGKTLKISVGIELAFANDRPIVKLRGVSIMGIPIPNAWLGGMKNVDFIDEFGQDEGFWKSFSDGVENIQIEEGRLVVKLKE